eukprot:20472_5
MCLSEFVVRFFVRLIFSSVKRTCWLTRGSNLQRTSFVLMRGFLRVVKKPVPAMLTSLMMTFLAALRAILLFDVVLLV